MQNWHVIEQLFAEALRFDNPADRAAYVRTHSNGDDELRDLMLRLLENDSNEEGRLDRSAVSLGLRALGHARTDRFVQGSEFAHYRLIRLIGRGGTGSVYLADDKGLNRRVALKILPENHFGPWDVIARFRQEARLASKIDHPCVARVYEFGEHGGYHYISMEFVDGRTVRELIQAGPLEPEAVLSIARQICHALKAAHDQGIVHRDIKPENVSVTKDGIVKVLDFGLAKVLHPSGSTLWDTILETVPGLLMGTTAYMSPERVRGRPTDSKTDIWSFGIVLFEMVTGERPFDGETPADTLAAILHFEPLPVLPSSSVFAPIIHHCLQKDPADRYHSADELLSKLEKVNLLDGKPTSSQEVVVTEQTNLMTNSGAAIAVSEPGSTVGISGLARARRWPLLASFGSLVAAICLALIYGGYRLLPPAETELADLASGVPEKKPGATRTNSLGIEFVFVPPGEFTMGSDSGQADERPVHKVTIPNGFWMSKHEVTQAQFQKVVGNNPSEIKGCDDCPVDNLTWYKAKEMVWKLNAIDSDFVYRMPTEAEWEYAARAGTTGPFAGNLDEIAWYLDNSNYRQRPVGTKLPNAFGLHDMHGNVWEWCEDIYQKSYAGMPTDGSANVSAGNPDFRVLRGGSARNDQAEARSSRRFAFGRGVKVVHMDFGIRLVAQEKTRRSL